MQLHAYRYVGHRRACVVAKATVPAFRELLPDARSTYNPSSLAYLGDAVWEAHVRNELLKQRHASKKTPGAKGSATAPRAGGGLHDRCQAYTCAEGQAVLVDALLSSQPPVLHDAELGVLRWGRNADVSPPRNVAVATYKKATGLEVLLAWLYLTDPARCGVVMHALMARHTQQQRTLTVTASVPNTAAASTATAATSGSAVGVSANTSQAGTASTDAAATPSPQPSVPSIAPPPTPKAAGAKGFGSPAPTPQAKPHRAQTKSDAASSAAKTLSSDGSASEGTAAS